LPALIRPGSVKVVTQDGEVQVSITIELNINLNADGLASINASPNIEQKITTQDKKTVEDTAWAIPDFGSSTINFGKRE